MAGLSRIPGDDSLFVGGIWVLNIESYRNQLLENNITHILSVIKFSFEKWGEEAKRFTHKSIDIDDDESSDLLVHFPAAVRFIDSGLQSETAGDEAASTPASASLPKPGVYVHCAMGKSRSVSCVVAYLLYKYPHRFGGKQFVESAASAQRRRDTAKEAVEGALNCVRQGRPGAEPNPGFMRQLELWWEMGCPAGDDGAVERHPIYQKWLYDGMLQEARDMRMAPDADQIRFEDEVRGEEKGQENATVARSEEAKEVRCKKCRRTLATPNFLVSHSPTGQSASSNCAHIFIDTLSWMRPLLEDGALDGRLVCPNSKCGATVGRFAWQGLQCTCKQWVVPAFSLNRSRVDEVNSRPVGSSAIRMPPGRSGSL
ncbi:protein-tyrosine phosphatase-like protein [Xylaria bambusicola]|uniref:protein-tyrosine phosphatase-like protein n=1 Tax=Xylaria bambusicola TaxID=326684 RepID=UPI002008BFE0|nr:protein-tyrosine phosphatase-like protein [Xylaria bambusicola]KAI0513095.1 protein-tyrosine phosphatase-like protein [Xylaria bambusicola]